MSDRARIETVETLLEKHGQTFAEEIGINLTRNTPAPLYQLLVASLLFSARIESGVAASAARALFDAGWTTPKHMLDADWRERAKVLNEAGYARYDESTAKMLGKMSSYLTETYDGDLRNLREAAHGKAGGVLARLKEFKGIGDVGAAIFLREVQAVWTEFCPFLDERAQKTAEALGLETTDEALMDYAGGDAHEFARIAAALIRSTIAHDQDDIVDVA